MERCARDFSKFNPKQEATLDMMPQMSPVHFMVPRGLAVGIHYDHRQTNPSPR